MVTVTSIGAGSATGPPPPRNGNAARVVSRTSPGGSNQRIGDVAGNGTDR